MPVAFHPAVAVGMVGMAESFDPDGVVAVRLAVARDEGVGKVSVMVMVE